MPVDFTRTQTSLQQSPNDIRRAFKTKHGTRAELRALTMQSLAAKKTLKGAPSSPPSCACTHTHTRTPAHAGSLRFTDSVCRPAAVTSVTVCTSDSPFPYTSTTLAGEKGLTKLIFAVSEGRYESLSARTLMSSNDDSGEFCHSVLFLPTLIVWTAMSPWGSVYATTAMYVPTCVQFVGRMVRKKYKWVSTQGRVFVLRDRRSR